MTPFWQHHLTTLLFVWITLNSILTDTVQLSSVTQLCPTLCNPMDCSMPAFPVHHQHPELTKTHFHPFHPTISSSVIPFSSCLQSFPASGSFPISQFLASDGQSIEVSASASVLPFPLGWTGWISFAVQETLKSLLQHYSSKHQFFSSQLSLWSNSHIHTWPLGKPYLSLDGPLLEK